MTTPWQDTKGSHTGPGAASSNVCTPGLRPQQFPPGDDGRHRKCHGAPSGIIRGEASTMGLSFESPLVGAAETVLPARRSKKLSEQNSPLPVQILAMHAFSPALTDPLPGDHLRGGYRQPPAGRCQCGPA
jgi:hypothetical protein